MALATLAGLSLDCDDPAALAGFYSRLLGLEISYTSDEFVYVGEMGSGLGFAKVDEYVPPTWPSADVPKQAHLECGVTDLDSGEAAILGIGATKPEFQPMPDRWRVLLDPAGHPFCISVMA
ncbi:VOC family protein [Actinoplanes utahensis]|uniref:Glyoxalase n=1 Tax=Actinoplanes utahensis TaxID=1869 RepID=A0A0A6XBA9_ACTUT|nr:VOC family protein [Actinoplanes utahensis]KHD77362.1 glyoxalase [Actinoplanes utahensis]GIF32892.1 glyoxalase [Actinoplanes utahensis]